MEANEYLVNMYRIIRAYDPDMETEKSRRFARDIFDLNVDIVVPLTKEETLLYRKMIGAYKTKSNTELAKEMGKHIFGIKKMKVIIYKTLRLYFLDVHRNEPDYPWYAINSDNEDITIFELGISYRGICALRNFKCYYLKDVTCVNFDDLKCFMGKEDYEILVASMIQYDLPFDWAQKKARLVMCNPNNAIFY